MACSSCKDSSLKELQKRVNDLKKKTDLLEKELNDLEKKEIKDKKMLIFLD